MGLVQFFKDLIDDKLEGMNSDQKILSFNNIISTVRRGKLLDALQGEGEKQRKGEKILHAFKDLLYI